VIKIRNKNEESIFTVAGGIAEVLPDQVTVLADSAENIEEIDISRAESARKRAEELLHKAIPQDTDTYLSLQAALKRSNLRLESAHKYRKNRI